METRCESILIGRCFDCDEWVGDNVCLPFKDISGNLFLNKMFTLRINHRLKSFGSFVSVFISWRFYSDI